jgi:hypothetical protein
MDGVVGRFVTRWKEGEYVVSRAFSRLQETLVSGEFGVTWLLADRTLEPETRATVHRRIRVLWSLSLCGVDTAT